MRFPNKLVLAILILVALPSSGIEETRVHLYIRSFIPRDHPGNPGYVRAVPGHPGEFVIPAPLDEHACFMTDNRLFSDEISASSRVTTEIVLVIADSTVRVEKANGREFSRTDESRKVDCQTGIDLVPRKRASTSMMHFGKPAFADGIAQIVIDGRANNPIPPISPDIQYGGSFTFDTRSKTLRFVGSVAVFPAYEAYAQLEQGPLVTVFQKSPAKGSTAWNLIDAGTGILKLQAIDVTVKLKIVFTKFRTISRLNNKMLLLQGQQWIVVDADTGKVEQTLFETARDKDFLYLKARQPTDVMNEQRISVNGGPWQFKSERQWLTLYSKTTGE